jgi:hypothetical protein
MGPWANTQQVGYVRCSLLPMAQRGGRVGRGKPTSVNPLGPGGPDGPPLLGFVLVSFTSEFTSILTNITSRFADNHR